jgi:hypothetical protein
MRSQRAMGRRRGRLTLEGAFSRRSLVTDASECTAMPRDDSLLGDWRWRAGWRPFLSSEASAGFDVAFRDPEINRTLSCGCYAKIMPVQ